MKVINNTVELTNMHLAELPSFLSQVDEIRGNFNVYRNRLKSLNNCPKSINAQFFTTVDLSHNQLTNLIGGFKKITASSVIQLNFGFNKLTSLEGFPELISKKTNVYLNDNKLTTLGSYLPSRITYLDLSYNPLSSLQGCPQIIGESGKKDSGLDVKFTNLKSMVGGPKEIDGFLDINGTEIESLEGFPDTVYGPLLCGDTPLMSSFRNASRLFADIDNFVNKVPIESHPDVILYRKAKRIFTDGIYDNYDEYEEQFDSEIDDYDYDEHENL